MLVLNMHFYWTITKLLLLLKHVILIDIFCKCKRYVGVILLNMVLENLTQKFLRRNLSKVNNFFQYIIYLFAYVLYSLITKIIRICSVWVRNYITANMRWFLINFRAFFFEDWNFNKKFIYILRAILYNNLKMIYFTIIINIHNIIINYIHVLHFTPKIIFFIKRIFQRKSMILLLWELDQPDVSLQTD